MENWKDVFQMRKTRSFSTWMQIKTNENSPLFNFENSEENEIENQDTESD